MALRKVRRSRPTTRKAKSATRARSKSPKPNVRRAAKIIQPAINYLIKNKCKKIILGCTELPIAIFAFKSIKTVKSSRIFLDPNLILANAAIKKYKN